VRLVLNEDKATRYHRRRRRAGLMAQAASAGVLLALLLSGAVESLAQVASRLAGTRQGSSYLTLVAASAIFAVLAGVPVVLARLPFDVLREWTLDRAYGLDRGALTAWLRGYVRDMLWLGFMATCCMVTVRTAARVGREWWVVAALTLWGGHVAWTIAFPALLHALGGMRPLARPPLVDRLRRLGERAGTSLEMYEWRAGGDTRRAHAMLTGVGRTRSVILSDTLLDSLTAEEIEVVVAHELAHHVHGDIRTALLWILVRLTAGFGAASLALQLLAPVIGVMDPTTLSAQPLIGLAAWGVAAALAPVGLAHSRAKERRADAFAIRITANADAFLTSMRRLASSNLLEERPSLLTRMLSSHPSIHERMAAAAAGRTSDPIPQRSSDRV
jgi:Zn-dependent protease with chaperone function